MVVDLEWTIGFQEAWVALVIAQRDRLSFKGFVHKVVRGWSFRGWLIVVGRWKPLICIGLVHLVWWSVNIIWREVQNLIVIPVFSERNVWGSSWLLKLCRVYWMVSRLMLIMLFIACVHLIVCVRLINLILLVRSLICEMRVFHGWLWLGVCRGYLSKGILLHFLLNLILCNILPLKILDCY